MQGVQKMYILASDILEKEDKYVFKVKNSYYLSVWEISRGFYS